jgi:hypothetical protein
MRARRMVFLLSVVVAVSAMQLPEPPLSEMRLTVHTLVREDIFAGFMSGNMDRFARGERNIDALLQSRPDQKANLLAWKASAQLYRAALAHEARNAADVKQLLGLAMNNFEEARKLSDGNDGVAAITGGSTVVLADRLPEPDRSQLWSQGYASFNKLWKQQGAGIDKLPEHFKGELLSGLAMSAQRTGHKDEAVLYADKIIALMPDTAYGAAAKQWKADPNGDTRMTCRSCHAPGRLSARLAEIKGGT